MKAKHETIRGASLFYVFLSFPADTNLLPNAFVLPSDEVATILHDTHRAWLAQPGRGGRAHQDGEMRRLLPDFSKVGMSITHGPGWLETFRDAWHLLQRPDTRNAA